MEQARLQAKLRHMHQSAVVRGQAQQGVRGAALTGTVDSEPEETLDVWRRAYDDCLAYVDRQFEQLLAGLGERGLLDNTLIVVTADHGEHLGEHALIGHGQSLYRPVLHVPLLLAGPDVPAGMRIASPVSTRDIAATLTDLIGHTESPFAGRSLARYWRSTEPIRPDPLLAVMEQKFKLKPNPRIPASNGPLWAVTDRGFTYIRHGIGREELYSLSDVEEARDLSREPAHGETLRTLRTTMDQLLAERDETPKAAR
jgi:arylsulfatase A-like enzyme